MAEIRYIVQYVDQYGYRNEGGVSLYAPDTPLVRSAINHPEILEEVCITSYCKEHPNHRVISIKIISIRS